MRKICLCLCAILASCVYEVPTEKKVTAHEEVSPEKTKDELALAASDPSGGGDDPCISEPLMADPDRVCAPPPPSPSQRTIDTVYLARNEFCEQFPHDPGCDEITVLISDCHGSVCYAALVFEDSVVFRADCTFHTNGVITCITVFCPDTSEDCIPIVTP